MLSAFTNFNPEVPAVSTDMQSTSSPQCSAAEPAQYCGQAVVKMAPPPVPVNNRQDMILHIMGTTEGGTYERSERVHVVQAQYDYSIDGETVVKAGDYFIRIDLEGGAEPAWMHWEKPLFEKSYRPVVERVSVRVASQYSEDNSQLRRENTNLKEHIQRLEDSAAKMCGERNKAVDALKRLINATIERNATIADAYVDWASTLLQHRVALCNNIRDLQSGSF